MRTALASIKATFTVYSCLSVYACMTLERKKYLFFSFHLRSKKKCFSMVTELAVVKRTDRVFYFSVPIRKEEETLGKRNSVSFAILKKKPKNHPKQKKQG